MGASELQSRQSTWRAWGLSSAANTMCDLTTESDEDLLRRSASGDEEAFAALYRRRQAAVYRFALHMSGREEVAEEVTQETFLMLIREPSRFDAGRGSVSSFLFGVARNLVLRQLERRREYVNIEEDSAAEPAAADTDMLAKMTREETIPGGQELLVGGKVLAVE